MRSLFASMSPLALLVATASGVVAQDFPQPTPAHKAMAREVGTWDASVRVWMTPDAPPETSAASETCKMLGGFWLVTEFNGDMGGIPFTGRSQMGYDADSGEYFATWIDSMAPAMYRTRGKYDVATHTLTLAGEGDDWMTGEPKRMKMITRYIDDNNKRFEIHESPIGSDDWRKTMEIDYTRK